MRYYYPLQIINAASKHAKLSLCYIDIYLPYYAV